MDAAKIPGGGKVLPDVRRDRHEYNRIIRGFFMAVRRGKPVLRPLRVTVAHFTCVIELLLGEPSASATYKQLAKMHKNRANVKNSKEHFRRINATFRSLGCNCVAIYVRIYVRGRKNRRAVWSADARASQRLTASNF